MANPLPFEKKLEIYEMARANPRLSNRKLAAKLGVSDVSVMTHREKPPDPPADADAPESMTDVEIKKLIKNHPMSAEELADALDRSPKTIRAAIAKMQARGAMVHQLPDGRYDLHGVSLLEPQKTEEKAVDRGDGWTVFGFISDNHLGNKHSRLDVLNDAYDRFAAEGITTVYNAGNWIDGVHKFNMRELVTAPGMDPQLDYMIDKYPQKAGILTKYIAGDDHEGWLAQRERIEIGKYLELRARDQGRSDLVYLGYAEHDIELKHGGGSALLRVAHPGGGSSYATSYAPQKLVESYQGGEKPDILLLGHWHKWGSFYPREVHTVLTGCTTDQSLFMRKLKLQAHVGFGIIKLQQDKGDGHVTRFSPEWFAYYDRGYYDDRRFA